VTFASTVTGATVTGEVASAPNGSSAGWISSTFRPDLPGRYRLRVRAAIYPPTEFMLVAFPVEAATCPPVFDRNWWHRPAAPAIHVDPRTPDQIRQLLHRIASGAFRDFTDAELAELDAFYPIPAGVDFSKA
jgi:hypothetical protein